ncbi:MAG: hypothetical protein JW902_09765 [Syntrophaceae bacterium]|nr:hypothetical protein [Syntrophaceae bacterium]
MSNMNPREVILANIEHSGAPRPGLCFDRGRHNDFFACGCGEPIGYRQKRWVEGNLEYYDDPWGNLWCRMLDGCIRGEVHTPAITDWDQLKSYRPPQYDIAKVADNFRAEFAKDRRNRFKLAHVGGWIFDSARYLRKMEVYFTDMALYPEELRQLHRLVASTYEGKILAAGRANADGIMIGEDMGTQQGLLFSPGMWRDYFSDEYSRLFALAHECGMKVLMHSCGKNWEILPDLLAAGVDVFQFDQPTIYDMPRLAALLKESHAALWSPVDIQKIMPSGDRQIITEGAREMCRIFEGGLICKNYPDLPGIGVEPAWDQWAYEAICEFSGLSPLDDDKPAAE